MFSKKEKEKSSFSLNVGSFSLNISINATVHDHRKKNSFFDKVFTKKRNIKEKTRS